jgi:hypothetical protein
MRSRIVEGRAARLAFALAVVGMAFISGGLVSGQEHKPEVRLTVEGGIDNWVDPHWPMKITARIETDILLVGELMVVQGQELARVEVEVPANGARTYEVVTAPPQGQGAILLRVIPDGAGDNEPVASAFFRPRVAEDEILVGVVGLSGLEQTLGEVRSAVGDSPVTPVDVVKPEDRLQEGSLHQLSYLVLDRPRLLPTATLSWLNGGGRIITTTAALKEMGLDVSHWGNFPGVDAEVEWYGVGDGEVLALENLFGQDGELWASVFRPLPMVLGNQEGFTEGPLSLTRAALGVESETPRYLWLPLVVVVYAVVVGPVNLWILRRRRKLEWAWFTIPAVGLIGVAAFWIVGNSGVNQTFWSHGTVQVTGPSPEMRSAVVAATSRARNLGISFNPGWDAFPEDPDLVSGGSAQPRITEAGVFEYDLPPLGWLSMNAFSREQPVAIDVAYSERGVEMTNSSSSPVVAWGVHAYPKVAVGEELQPGEVGFVGWNAVPNSASWWVFGDALWELDTMRESDSNRNWPAVVGDMGNMAQRSGMIGTPSFVFAVLEESIDYLEVKAEGQTVPGMKLVLFPIPAEQMGHGGWAFPRPLWVDDSGVDFDGFGVDFDGFQVFAQNGILSYRLPPGLSDPPRLVLGGLDPEFNGFNARGPRQVDDEVGRAGNGQMWEVWEWGVSEFVPFDISQPLDPGRFVAASGEVLIKISDFGFDMPILLSGVMMWGDMSW